MQHVSISLQFLNMNTDRISEMLSYLLYNVFIGKSIMSSVTQCCLEGLVIYQASQT